MYLWLNLTGKVSRMIENVSDISGTYGEGKDSIKPLVNSTFDDANTLVF